MSVFRKKWARLGRGDRLAIAAGAVAVVTLAVTFGFSIAGAISASLAAGIGWGTVSVFTAIALVGTRRASQRSGGIEARFWRLMSYGLLSWTLGSIPYWLFLATGGTVDSPAAWSQVGFLLAYPFWYRGLWMLRQPAMEESRRGAVESAAIELSVFALLGFIVLAMLWYHPLPVAENVAQLVPITLDLLLLAALYNAVRRSRVTHETAAVWFAYAFGCLAISDALVTYLVTRGVSVTSIGLVLAGYMVTFSLVTVASRHALRVTEARVRLVTSKTLLAATGLALCAPASVIAWEPIRPVIWGLAAILCWRLAVLLRQQGESETDPLSGFLEERAFSRHVSGVVAAASSARPALLLGIDLDGFGRWNAQNGYAAGDAILSQVAEQLENADLEDGVWSRLGSDRFAWIGSGYGAEEGRRIAEIARAAAASNDAGISARATVVVLPDDAATTANALAALDEGLGAARAGRRRVVAFDRGRLDGVEYEAGYTASLAKRRDAILEILADPQIIQTVYQPIVALDDGRTVGFEALSRFRAEPQRPPDRWIAEAHAVGLGLEIEVECVRRACRVRGTLPAGAYLSVNMSPDAILTPEMDAALGAGSLDGIVIEITEHEAVGDYARLGSRLAEYRGRGALVAIDDTGAGHASMRHVTQLAPDYIKVDRSLIHDLHLDHAKRALVRSMVTLEKDLGAQIVAEGIESAEELRALRELGVPLGQGYLLARPRTAPTPAPWCAASLELAGPLRQPEA
ncbi:MAG: EAL domain-containing protein [Thermoleophilia bacterium]